MQADTERHALALSRMQGARVFLALVVVAGVFGAIVFAGIDRSTAASARPDPLRDWSTSRVFAELGDYTQIFDCAQIGAQGMSGFVWVKTNALGQPTRILLICRP